LSVCCSFEQEVNSKAMISIDNILPDFIGFFIIPPIIPGFVFGPLYLALTVYLSKNGPGSINHSAHLWGALYGIVFLIIASKVAGIEGQSDVINSFIEQIKLYLNKF
jgi:membrane associated rhomboid family serine protease